MKFYILVLMTIYSQTVDNEVSPTIADPIEADIDNADL